MKSQYPQKREKFPLLKPKSQNKHTKTAYQCYNEELDLTQCARTVIFFWLAQVENLCCCKKRYYQQQSVRIF
jgi:hypothetical protein